MRPRALSLLFPLMMSCGKGLPRPPYAPQPTTALVEVPFPPPPARVEAVPLQPDRAAVWIDGEWRWRGRKWGWRTGRWVIPPPGVAYSPWTSVRDAEGTLYQAVGVWRDAHGEVVAEPKPIGLGSAATPDGGGPAEEETSRHVDAGGAAAPLDIEPPAVDGGGVDGPRSGGSGESGGS